MCKDSRQFAREEVCRYGLVILELDTLRFEVGEGEERGAEGGLLGTLKDLTHGRKGFGNETRDDL